MRNWVLREVNKLSVSGLTWDLNLSLCPIIPVHLPCSLPKLVKHLCRVKQHFWGQLGGVKNVANRGGKYVFPKFLFPAEEI